MVRTLRCGRNNPGSNPGYGNFLFFVLSFFSQIFFLLIEFSTLMFEIGFGGLKLNVINF